MATRKALIAAQEEYFPGSTILDGGQVLTWAHDLPKDSEERNRRLAAIASTVQHDTVVFYLTPRGNIGARFGTDGADYISGFNSRFVGFAPNGGLFEDTTRFVF